MARGARRAAHRHRRGGVAAVPSGRVNLIRARFDDLTGGGSSFELRRLLAIHQATEPGQVETVIEAAAAAARDGAWVAGFVSYEAAPALDPSLAVTAAVPSLPLAWFAAFAERVEVDPIGPADAATPEWRMAWDPARHATAVGSVREWLAAGDTYQVNLTVRATATVPDGPALYSAMARAQGGAYNALIDTGSHVVACASPELFFEVQDGHVVTRPMKGTRARGRWPAEDAVLRQELAASAKDASEHVMIVDLVRNDLGRIAVPGRVRVEAWSQLERYPTVWQLTSTIGADLARDVGLVGIFRALFPCGSVTGAPKPRTMQIIAELEGAPRGVYCGAVGYLAPGSTLQARFAVAIRTATVDVATGRGEYGAGGGITWESDAAAEWQEVQAKCAVLRNRPSPEGLLETFAGGSPNVARHLDRMAASAGHLGLPFDRAHAERAVLAADATGRRVRVMLDPSGRLDVQVSDLPAPTPGPVHLGLAREAVDSTDGRLFHKGLDRRRYDEARADYADVDDVVLFNERGDVTETTIANLAVRLDGQWWTPPVSCGLLPGVERGRLLESGVLRERVLRLEDLCRAADLAVVNSLRGWRPAVLCLQ